MFSSKSDEWSTPQDCFTALDDEFHFVFDAAARAENAKCREWFGPDHPHPARRDFLTAVHYFPNQWGFCNPPYSRGLQKKFIIACATRRYMVMLLPARTDTAAFHDYIWDTAAHQPLAFTQVRFLRGRLKFGGCKDAAPFPSMVVVFQ